MKTIGRILTGITLVFAVVGIAALAGGAAGKHVVEKSLVRLDGEPARAKVTFPREHQIEVQVPSVVRGQRINCIIFADVKRRISSVSC